jgi:cytoskeletal protein RodZ
VPESGSERLLFTLGIVAIGLLAAIVIFEARRHDPSAAASSAGATVTTAASPTPTVATKPHATVARVTTTTATTTAKEPTPTAPPAASRLKLTATADTWLSVRKDSTTGAVLYEGVLSAGETRVFSGAAFAVRFGDAANVRATLNGRALALPGGTYSVTIDKSGLGARSA